MDLYIISGVTGMTGNELARQLLEKQQRVIGFDNFFASSIEMISDIKENTLFTFFQYDLNQDEEMASLENLVQKEKKNCDRVIYINCAAVVHTEHFYHVDATFLTNVIGMKKFLEQAIRVNAVVFINCSTSEVYSMQSFKEGGIEESDFLVLANAEHSQRTSYAAGKLMTEFFIKDAVDKGLIKGASLRFANVYSKNELLPKHIIPHILTSLYQTGSITLLENSKQNKRTFLHNYDSCQAVLALINQTKALDGTIYNVATMEEVSILELVQMAAEKLGIAKPDIIFDGYRESDPKRRVLSSKKLQDRTGWKPKVSLSQGLDMCISFMKEKDEIL